MTGLAPIYRFTNFGTVTSLPQRNRICYNTIMPQSDPEKSEDDLHAEVEQLRAALIEKDALIQRNIAEQMQALARLKESEERWQFAMESAGHGVWDWDATTNKVYYSHQWKAMLGYEDSEVGDTLWEWDSRLHPDDREQTYTALNQHLEGHSPLYVSEHRLRCKDGSYKWIYDRGKVMTRTPDGKPWRVLGTHTDISERKRIEEELRAARDQLNTITDNIPVMISHYTKNGDYLYVNEPTARYFNKKKEDFVGKNVRDIALKDAYERAYPYIQRVLNGEKLTFQNVIPNGLGEPRLIHLHYSPQFDPQGKVIGYYAMSQDITEQKAIERALIEAEKLAGIGTLAAGMAHEINNPLQVITGNVESLLRRIKQGKQVEQEELARKLETLHSNAWRIAAIVRSLLDYARSSTNEARPCSINEIVKSALTIVEHQFKSWANIIILTDLSPDLPPVTCDGNKIIQILINLLTNARDAMPCGGQITIQTGCQLSSNCVFLRVIDSGEGIPSDIQDRIFDPFFTTKPLGCGTGLGLAIAAGIARAHGGTLFLEKSSKEGSVFTLQLPLSPKNSEGDDNTIGLSGRF